MRFCFAEIIIFLISDLYECMMYENDGVQIFQALDPLYLGSHAL